ncbi:Esterase LovG [Madurella mycetomatis]|uniref:Esterase LovG n=1 Tax=Madurella mycetomatis TaxID=100816 RepID=A0A175VYJ7_9PEZI|nr:Esterase LovG [Madurella mycetomatis]
MPPKILFLHGSGTNAAIFRVQSRKLAALLSPHFELVYLDAFLPCAPGPGVLPFFEGSEPYLKWLCDSTPQDEARYWGDHASAGAGGSASLERLVAEYKRLGPFVGVVGFSQGAKAGMYLLRRLEELSKGGLDAIGMRFFLAVCGTARPRDGAVPSVAVESIHVIGDVDPWKEASETLVGYFEAASRKVVRFKEGHHMPAEDGVNKFVAELVIAAYEDSEGIREALR